MANPITDAPPSSRCASCGQCCLSLPGQFYPADLGETVEQRRAKTAALLRTGLYSLDWWEGGTADRPDLYRVLHLRPSTIEARGHIYDASWGGACVMLSKDGCTLPREDRPTVCKALVPGERDCKGLSKYDLSVAWQDDQDWLEEIADLIEDELDQ